MPLDLPIRLGPFLVDDQGRLLPQTPDVVPALTLEWRNLTVAVRLTASRTDPPEDGRLAMSAIVGRVPSTAETAEDGGARRQHVLATVAALTPLLGPGWQVGLTPDHRIGVAAAQEIALPTTAHALVTELTCLLLALAPYLDALAEPGFAEAGGRTGMANT